MRQTENESSTAIKKGRKDKAIDLLATLARFERQLRDRRVPKYF